MIRFTKDGDFFREIDEERNYFLVEAEEIVEKIRGKLRQEKERLPQNLLSVGLMVNR